jgi:hypothetical protein
MSALQLDGPFEVVVAGGGIAIGGAVRTLCARWGATVVQPRSDEPQAIRELCDQLERVDAVVVDVPARVGTDVAGQWHEQRDCIRGAFASIRGALPSLRAAGPPAGLVLTSSALATAPATAGAATRAALRNLIRCFAVEAGADGVRVNAVLPCVESLPTDAAWAASVAEVIAFLCSPSACYVHGVVLLDDPPLHQITAQSKGRS